MAASPASRLNVSELPAQADDDHDTDSIRDESGQRRGSDPSRVCRHFPTTSPLDATNCSHVSLRATDEAAQASKHRAEDTNGAQDYRGRRADEEGCCYNCCHECECNVYRLPQTKPRESAPTKCCTRRKTTSAPTTLYQSSSSFLLGVTILAGASSTRA